MNYACTAAIIHDFRVAPWPHIQALLARFYRITGRHDSDAGLSCLLRANQSRICLSFLNKGKHSRKIIRMKMNTLIKLVSTNSFTV